MENTQLVIAEEETIVSHETSHKRGSSPPSSSATGSASSPKKIKLMVTSEDGSDAEEEEPLHRSGYRKCHGCHGKASSCFEMIGFSRNNTMYQCRQCELYMSGLPKVALNRCRKCGRAIGVTASKNPTSWKNISGKILSDEYCSSC